MKTCRRCGSTKAHSEFHSHPETADRLHTWCKDCQREYQRENRERINALARDRYKARTGSRK